MADKNKKISCRVCGKLFTPCAYCQSDTNEFRWKNFACSMKCAKKYIDDTIAYRTKLNNKSDKENKEKTELESIKKTDVIKNKINKDNPLDVTENITEKTKNIKTE